MTAGSPSTTIPPSGPCAAFFAADRELPVRQLRRPDRRAAALYSLIETAKLSGLDPQKYLADVLTRIADHPARQIANLLPWHWKPAEPDRAAA